MLFINIDAGFLSVILTPECLRRRIVAVVVQVGSFSSVIMSKRDLQSSGAGSTPLPPPPSTKKDKSSEMCVLCKKKILENTSSLFCECCSEWKYRICSGVSSEVYDVLCMTAKPYPNIMFFCSLCMPRVSLALKFFNEIEEKRTQLKARLV